MNRFLASILHSLGLYTCVDLLLLFRQICYGFYYLFIFLRFVSFFYFWRNFLIFTLSSFIRSFAVFNKISYSLHRCSRTSTQDDRERERKKMYVCFSLAIKKSSVFNTSKKKRRIHSISSKRLKSLKLIQIEWNPHNIFC